MTRSEPTTLTPDGVGEREQRRAHRVAANDPPRPPRRTAVAVDGKCLRGAKRTNGSQVFVLSAVRHVDAVLVRVAGTRWSIETCFQTGKTIGLDEPQVRRWHSWYRHTTLVMLAHAILTVITARERHDSPAADQALIPLTFNEIRRLFARLITNTVYSISHWLTWSHWRRQHQARAQTSHYHRRRQTIHQPAST